MRAIEVISIPVTDQQRSKDFYARLGFELLVEAPMGNGQWWLQMGLPGQVTTIALVSWWPYREVEMKAGTLHGLILETEDIEADVRTLRARGVLAGRGPHCFDASLINDTPLGRFVHFTDPDGNGINLHEFK
jgi:catechol 2,3-dioxygenase-like lactoylglutathione lyase family enzyme